MLKSNPLVELDTVKRQYQNARTRYVTHSDKNIILTVIWWENDGTDGSSDNYLLTKEEFTYITK